MYLSPLQSSADSTGNDGGDDDVPSFYVRKKKNIPRACLRCRRLKKRCSGQNPCFFCIKSRSQCEWVVPPDATPTDTVVQGDNGPPTLSVDLPQSHPRTLESIGSLPAEPCVQHGYVYDSPAETGASVPGPVTPTAVPQTFSVFPGAGFFDLVTPTGASGLYTNAPSAVRSIRDLTETTIVEGVPFYPNSPLPWSTPAARGNDQHDQPTVGYGPLYRPVDFDGHIRYSRGRVDTSEITQAAVQDAWFQTISDAAQYAASPVASHSVCTSAHNSIVPPTYAAQFHDNRDGSLLTPDAPLCQFADQHPVDGLPAGPLTFADDALYREQAPLPPPVSSYSTLSADQGLVDGLPTGPLTFADDVLYRSHAPLPLPVSSYSTLSGDHGCTFPDGPMTQTDNVLFSHDSNAPPPQLLSSTLSAENEVALPAGPLTVAGDALYSVPAPLPPPVSLYSTLSADHGCTFLDGKMTQTGTALFPGAHAPLSVSSTLFANNEFPDAAGPFTLADDSLYSARAPLPLQVSSYSSLSADHGCILPDGPVRQPDAALSPAYASLPPPGSSTLSGDNRFAVPGVGVTITGNSCYGRLDALPPPVTSSSTLTADHPLHDGTLHCMPGLNGFDPGNPNAVFSDILVPPSAHITGRSLQNQHLEARTTFPDADLWGEDHAQSSLMPPPSHEVDHNVQDAFGLGEGVLMFTDTDLLDMSGADRSMAHASSSQTADPDFKEALPGGTSTISDAEFEAWLLAGTDTLDCNLFKRV